MKVSALTIEALKDLVTGDTGVAPYMSGPKIIKFFNAFGVDDEYTQGDGGLPNGTTRNEYTIETLKKINGKIVFSSLVEALADHRRVQNPDEIAHQVNNIIKHDGYELEKAEDGIYKITGDPPQDPIEVKAHFAQIKEQIITHIRNAKFTIWVAMAWFTDKDLGNELRVKHKNGINVQVVVNDDEITNSHGLSFDSKGIEYVKVAPDSPWGKKIMHNKFCIIDLRVVIHGSYNWTGNAIYNNEAITITESREVAEEFASEFTKLKTNTDT